MTEQTPDSPKADIEAVIGTPPGENDRETFHSLLAMTPKLMPLLLLALPLGGCVAGIAASAVGMAIRSAQGEPQSNRHLQPTARAACSAHAAQYGAVHIIDVQQRSTEKIIVWGTVTDAKERRSFECAFTDRMAGFKLRAIRAQR